MQKSQKTLLWIQKLRKLTQFFKISTISLNLGILRNVYQFKESQKRNENPGNPNTWYIRNPKKKNHVVFDF